MYILHSHWQPPVSPQDEGGVLFWAESSSEPAPAWQRGRLPKKFRPREHPFCASAVALEMLLGAENWPRRVREGQVVLQLPSTRSGPQPSPALVHDWDLDQETRPFLAPWTVSGLWLPVGDALLALVHLPAEGRAVAGEAGGVKAGGEATNGSPKTSTGLAGLGPMLLGDDIRFWHTAAGLALEALATQKLVPVLAPADSSGKVFHARWLPVLDAPRDAARLAVLERAMPPVCRATLVEAAPERSSRSGRRSRSGRSRGGKPGGRGPGGDQPPTPLPPPSPRAVLESFLNTGCDALARRLGHSAAPRFAATESGPPQRWLAALFKDDPSVEASPAQLQALAMSQQAWLRNLHVAGDQTFRVAFRLEAPAQQLKRPQEPRWQLHYLLQARDDPSLLVPAEAVWETRGSVLNQLDRRFEQPQEKLLAGLGYAARLFPPLASSLKGKKPTNLALDANTAYNFLREAAPILEGAGFGLLVPPWWNKPGARLGLRLRLRPNQGQNSAANGKDQRGVLAMDKLVKFKWELSLGDTTLTEAEFRALAKLKSPLVQIRGQWVQLDPEQIEAAIRFWEQQDLEGDISLLEAVQIELGAKDPGTGLPVDAVDSEGWLAGWLERFKQPEILAAGNGELLPQPDGLQGLLRPYQRYGYSWLNFLRRFGLGACLADDMGLGKTIQTLALLLREKEANGSLPAPTLLVCPTSVVTNWEREVERFAPALTTLIHQGANRARGAEFVDAVRGVDMVLTSYTLVRQDAEIMQTVPWLGVILDEAQNIKNPAARQTQSVRKLNAAFRVALTGTPVENRLQELWSIMHFLNPGYLGSQQAFRREFGLPIERYKDAEAAERLKGMVGPFILRRVKTDPRVIQDLPDKLEMKVYCHLSEEQATLYEAVVQDALKKVEESSGMERRGLVLSMLMQLKQICNHPAHYLHQVESGGKRQARGDEPDEGSADLEILPAGGLVGRSGKLERLVEMLDEILAVGERTLIFTQFAEMGHLLAQYLPGALGVPALFLHGGVPMRARDSMVRRFQDDEHGPPVFILSLKAGGTGLNLTRANHVFHFDRWWNPAVENQATDRAFRIGQTRNVQVHKFITTGTLEEHIDEMIESKKELAEAVIGGGEGWLTELSNSDLRSLVGLRREQVAG